MDETTLYHQIANAIRKEILNGRYKPGERLPSVRRLCEDWNCTPGTVQRAYNALAQEGLLVSRAGRGTQVAGAIPHARAQEQQVIRRASLVNRMEAALLEALTAGYTQEEIQQALDLALDHWRSMASAGALPAKTDAGRLRFAGSHDPLVNDLGRAFFGKIAPGAALERVFSGSLGGLIALAEGRADLAGAHLWDAETDTYNLPFVRRVLPGQAVALVRLAARRMGLIVAPGNPLGIVELADLARAGARFANRQAGSGTRVWLDAMLERLGIDPKAIEGYAAEHLTHSDVARTVARGEADAGLGLETAALAYGLDFVFLHQEPYDLVMRAETLALPAVAQLVAWLASEEGRAFVDQHPGYSSGETGLVASIAA